jgi:hypothetical protein
VSFHANTSDLERQGLARALRSGNVQQAHTLIYTGHASSEDVDAAFAIAETVDREAFTAAYRRWAEGVNGNLADEVASVLAALDEPALRDEGAER